MSLRMRYLAVVFLFCLGLFALAHAEMLTGLPQSPYAAKQSSQAGFTTTPSTAVPRYANDLGWNLVGQGPHAVTLNNTLLPGMTKFSAVNIVCTATDLWVGVSDATPTASEFVRINPQTLKISAIIPIGTALNFLAFAPGGLSGKIWATDPVANAVYRVDVATNAVDLSLTSVGLSSPHGIIYGAGKMMVSDTTNNRVMFFDANSGTNLGTTSTGASSTPYYSEYDGVNFRVSLFGTAQEKIINPSTQAVSATLTTGTQPWIPFSSGYRTYSSDYGASQVSIFDMTTNAALGSFPLNSGSGGTSHTLLQIRDAIWVIESGPNQIEVFDSSSYALRTAIGTGNDPSGLCFNGYNMFNIAYQGWSITRYDIDTKQ
jgi:hypothetical protein